MRLLLTKTVTYLLITAFMATGLGGAMGSIWCESGGLSDTHINNHIDDHSDKHTDDHAANYIDIHVDVSVGNQTVSLDQHYDDADSCLDSPILLDQGILKKIEPVKWAPELATTPINTHLIFAKSFGLLVNNLTLDPPPRVPHSIITHRTVVLLS